MRIPNKHFCAAMREALQWEQHTIAAKFQEADEVQREFLREQLLANERAFRRLRIRQENERQSR